MKAIKSTYTRPARKRGSSFMSAQRLALGAVFVLGLTGMMGVSNQMMTATKMRASSMLRSATRKLQEYTVKAISDLHLYKPAMIEKYIYDNAVALGYDTERDETSEGCRIWNDPSESTIYNELHTYRDEIANYWKALKSYSRVTDRNITDIRRHLSEDICPLLELDPEGRNLQQAFFPSGQLSFTASSGWVEPLAPPMRHPNFCMRKVGNILNIEYLVHDFANMCRKLKPTSRIVLFDIGADPKLGSRSPMGRVVDLFNQFGFKFDHIYAYETKSVSGNDVYEMVPRHLQAAYHWINTGLSIEEGNFLNPWTVLETEYNEDDLVIVKLDMDTHNMEFPLAHQLLNSPKLWKLVDQFYFEHHVRQDENTFWRKNWGGSVKDTLDLFNGLRVRGVPAHFWV